MSYVSLHLMTPVLLCYLLICTSHQRLPGRHTRMYTLEETPQISVALWGTEGTDACEPGVEVTGKVCLGEHVPTGGSNSVYHPRAGWAYILFF